MRRRHRPTDRYLAVLAGTSSPEDRRLLLETIRRELRVVGPQRHHPRQIDRVFRVLVGHLRDPSEDVRYEVAYGLSFWGERRAAWALLPVLLDPRETPRVRGQAAEGVGCGLGLRRLAPAQRERIRSALDAGLQDPEVEVRFWCLYAAGQTRMIELRPRIEHLRDTDPHLCPGLWYVRDEAADVLEYFDTDLWPERDFVKTEENG